MWEEKPELYDVARRVCHEFGLPWTDPRTGVTYFAPTYRIETVAGREAIRCLLCDRVSELPGDVINHYCSRCKLFHEHVTDAQRVVAEGGGHECSEWRTYRGKCALCGRELTELHVGDVVTVAHASGVNPSAARAVVVEVYTLSRRPGYTLLFADGRFDGFSPDDCALFGVERIGHDELLAGYRFVGATHLDRDYRAGLFARVWESKI